MFTGAPPPSGADGVDAPASCGTLSGAVAEERKGVGAGVGGADPGEGLEGRDASLSCEWDAAMRGAAAFAGGVADVLAFVTAGVILFRAPAVGRDNREGCVTPSTSAATAAPV